jgi:cytochrome c-type biogenesis protein
MFIEGNLYHIFMSFLDFIRIFWFNILLGILTPLGAICVIPLYPGFLAFLASFRLQTKSKTNRSLDENDKSNSKLFWQIIFLAAFVCIGILVSLSLVGFVFSTLLEVSLTNVIAVVSRIAFLFLAIYSVYLVFDLSLDSILRKFGLHNLRKKSFFNFFSSFSERIYSLSDRPFLASFLFGLFFGFIVLPCNPAPLVLFFSRELVSPTGFIGFIAFGIGLCIPLFLLAVFGGTSRRFLSFLQSHLRIINILSGTLMFGVSMYYLFFVF